MARLSMVSVAVFMCGALAALAQVPETRILLDFEDAEELKTLYQEERTDMRLVADYATSGAHALKLEFSNAREWPGFHIDKPPYIQGWQEYSKLAFDVYNPLDKPVVLSLRFDDAQTRDYQTRAHASVRLVPGQNRADILLASLRRENREAFDVGSLRRVIFFTGRPQETFHLYFDNIRLEKELAGGVGIKGAVFLDFGPDGQALMEGFEALSDKAAYAAEKGYGFVGELRSYGGRFPDDLVGDGVGPDRWGIGPAAFQLDRPNGEYVLYVWGDNRVATDASFSARSWALSVNGRRVAGKEVSHDTFYSEDGMFALMRDDYAPDRDAWETYIKPYWPLVRVEVSVTDGRLLVEGNGFEFWALGAAPLKAAPAADAFVARVTEERRKSFYDRHCYIEAPELPEPDVRSRAYDKASALLVYQVDASEDVRPWSRPSERQPRPQRLSLAGCPGETLVFTLAVVPTEDTGFKVEATQFERRGAVLPAGTLSTRYARYMLRAAGEGTWTWRPEVLLPGCPERLTKGVARWLWFVVTVPDDASGAYTAELKLASGEGAFTVPLRLNVRPYRLPAAAGLGCTFGWYYSPPDSVGYWTRWFPDAERYEKWLDAEFKWMSQQGCNSVQLPLPQITAADATGLKLDFADLDLIVRYMRKHRLGTEQPAQMNVLGLARRIVRSCGCQEYDDDFNRIYKAAIQAVEEWRKSAGIQLVYWVVDEPREQALNPWNRNLEGTVKYLQLLRELGLPASVTMMGDANRGVDYMPMVPLQDYIQTHPWAGSAKIIEYWQAHREHKMWFYNAGMDRLTWGFALYKSAADGFWQWHWRWCDFPYHPFVGVKWGVVYPGPDGPVPTPGYYRVLEGITDYRYAALAADLLARAPERSRRAASLKTVLADVLDAVPNIAGVKLEADEAVGDGLKGPAVFKAAGWRERIAAAIEPLHRELQQ